MACLDMAPLSALTQNTQKVDHAALSNAKTALRQSGWTHRATAVFLGVSFEHLNRVLNGHRESRRLLAAIACLPPRQDKAA